MNFHRKHTHNSAVRLLLGTFSAVAIQYWVGQAGAQGTLQVTFDGPPSPAPGTAYLTTNYTELGMLFTPILPNNLGSAFIRQGGGVPGYPVPDDGTPYLQAALGSTLSFHFTNGSAFSLVAVDLAGYSYILPDFSVNFVGYRPDSTTVSTTFSGTGTNFQTFYFNPDFSNLSRVEIPNNPWSLDNLVLSVPEPNPFAIALIGLMLAFARRRKHCARSH